MVASPQKALLDFFYINNYYNTEKDIKDLRLNETELPKIINAEFYRGNQPADTSSDTTFQRES